MSITKSYKLLRPVLNFRNINKEVLDFRDFRILPVSQGGEAAEWMNKLRCTIPPRNILVMEKEDYVQMEEDITGFDGLLELQKELLLLFRLFKPGDISFGRIVVEDMATGQTSQSVVADELISQIRYDFEAKTVAGFNAFREDIKRKKGYRNKFYRLSLDYFSSGMEKPFFYGHGALYWARIVDFITALESVFLVDNSRYFMGRTIKERVARFLNDQAALMTMKFMYNERSRIIHGDYLDTDLSKQQERLKIWMPRFEELMRSVYFRLFDFDFASQKDLRDFMRKLFEPPSESVNIMQAAEEDAIKYFSDREQ